MGRAPGWCANAREPARNSLACPTLNMSPSHLPTTGFEVACRRFETSLLSPCFTGILAIRFTSRRLHVRSSRPGIRERLESAVSRLFSVQPELETGATLNLPWGRVPLKAAFSTGRALIYLQYCLDQWEAGKPVYLLRLFGLKPYPTSGRTRLQPTGIACTPSIAGSTLESVATELETYHEVLETAMDQLEE